MFKLLGIYPWPFSIKKTIKPTTVSVPLCYLPNSKVQTFEVQTMRRSLYQIEYLLQVSQLPNFAYFVIFQHKGKDIIVTDDSNKSFIVLWCDKAGGTHAASVGNKKAFLFPAVKEGWPVQLDSVIYRVRTE